MSIIRVKKDEGYFLASNEPFNDKRLSWEARGLMGYLLSKPNNWEIKQRDLEKQGPAGDHKLRRMMAELRACGYINRIRCTLPNGQFAWITEVYESSSSNPNPSKQVTTRRFSTSGSSTRGKPPDLIITESEKTDKTNEEEGKLAFADAETFFQENFGPPRAYDHELLGDLCDDHTPYWTIQAMKIAVKNNARNLAYVDAILKRWKVMGYGTENKNGNSKQQPATPLPQGMAAAQSWYAKKKAEENVNA